MEVNVNWLGSMAFEADFGTHKLIMDAVKLTGGHDLGPTPKQVLLAAVAGCTGMDVAALMKKYRQPVEKFEIKTHANKTTEHPTTFAEINLEFWLTGEGLDADKIKEAVELSQTKYCAVSAMVNKTSPISYLIFVNGEKTAAGKADFPMT